MGERIDHFLYFTAGLLTYRFIQWFYQQKNDPPKKMTKKSNNTPSDQVEQELQNEQFSRISSFFATARPSGQDKHKKKQLKEAGFQCIRDSFVVVIGMGGVGSHAAHMLVRSGVKKIRLVDFDNVTLSSLNRHAVATRQDVGLAKVSVTKKFLLQILPDAEIEDIVETFNQDTADRLLEGNPSYVLDCIDDVTTKIALLSSASSKGLKIITSTGAGAKADPTRLHIGDLGDAADPLASKLRYYLKKREIDTKTITTVYSSETARCKLLPLDKDQIDNPNEFGNPFESWSCGFICEGTTPAIFGQAMAAFVLTDLGGTPLEPQAVARLTKDHRDKLYQKLQNREINVYGGPNRLMLQKSDIDFICQTIWRNRCAITEERMGGRTRMVLTRWNKELPASPGNVVLMSLREVDKMDANGITVFGSDIVMRIESKLAEFADW